VCLMSKDISITDLIAEARPSAEVFGSKTLYGRMFIALENARTTLDYDRDYIKMLKAKVDALEAVTVPTENERERLAKVIMEADSKTIDHDRKWPLALNADGSDNFYAEQWKSYLPHADAVLANCPTCKGEDDE
jgi:hypothetical protein